MGKRSTKEKGVRAALAAFLGVAGIAGSARSAEANIDQDVDINQNQPPASVDYATRAELGADERVTNIDSLNSTETERQQEMPREGYCLTISQGIDVNTGQVMMDTFYFDLDGNQISQKAVDNLLAGSGHLIIETTEITDDTKLPDSLTDEIISQRDLGNTPHLTGFKLVETSPGSSRRVQEDDSLESSDPLGVKVAAAMPGGEVLEEDGPITPTEGGGSPTDESGSEKIESTSPTDEFQGGSEITEVALNTLADNYGETMITSQASTDEKNMILSIAEVLPADYDRYQVTKAKIRFLDFYIITADGANVIYAKESGTIHWQKVESLEDLERMVRLSYEGWSVNEVTAGNLDRPLSGGLQEYVNQAENPYLVFRLPGLDIVVDLEKYESIFQEKGNESQQMNGYQYDGPTGVSSVVSTEAERESYVKKVIPPLSEASRQNQTGTFVWDENKSEWVNLPISSDSAPPTIMKFHLVSEIDAILKKYNIFNNDHLVTTKRMPGFLMFKSFKDGVLTIHMFASNVDLEAPSLSNLVISFIIEAFKGSESFTYIKPHEAFFINDPNSGVESGYPILAQNYALAWWADLLDWFAQNHPPPVK